MGKDRERRRRVKELFQAASSLQGDDRSACLRELATSEPELHAEVERLLAAERWVQDSDYLEEPAVDLHGLIGDGPAAPATSDATPDPNIGRRVGHYELTRELGSGGMGSVYLATRRDDYEQVVAIKLVKRGMDTAEVVRRFEYERQTLAGLDHPSIARVLDGGTDDGLPYFVMEYVDGLPVDVHCDRERLSLSDRLELFARVCDAVGYAHDNIVVHRDLKPANILVTSDGTPKLLDFGLARVLNPIIGFAPTDVTHAAERFLTASYASPEQLQGDVVGKPSDVYSLGIVLYQLLTGRRPFRLAGLPRRAIERIVSYQTPAPPSAVVREPVVGEGAEVTQPEEIGRLRGTRPEELARLLHRDVDNIVQMALRKEPRDRYADGNDLGADIRRWLEKKPLVAKRESPIYVARKFVQRHRILVGSATAVFGALVIGLVVSLVALKYAFEKRDLAETEGVARYVAAQRAAEEAMLAEERQRQLVSRRLAATVVFDPPDDPELTMLLAIEAVAQAPTVGAEYALRTALARVKPDALLAGHSDSVGGAAFGPSSERVVSVSRDRTARVWNARTGEVIATLEGHEGPVHSAVFNPDGTRVVTASDDGTARVWDAASGRELLVIRSTGPVMDALLTPDGRWVITTEQDGAIRTWDAMTGARGDLLAETDEPLSSVIVSPDGSLVGVGGAGWTGRVLERATGRELAVLEGHRGPVRDAMFDPTGELIVTGSDDQTARVWEARTGRQVLLLRGHHSSVRQVAFSPDGRWVVTASAGDTVRVWDATTGDLLRIEGGHAAAFSPDGEWLVVARHGNVARVLPWEIFAPLSDNLEEARARVTRELTPAERERYVREMTAEEGEAFLRQPPPIGQEP